MQTFLISIVFVAVSAFAKAQSSPAPQPSFNITVTVDNARSDEGKMMFSLNTKDQFMQSAPLKSDSVIIKDGVATVIFNKVPAGDYAVLVLHDKNGNKRMDFESNGMPKEPYGMSNNPMSYGPPVFEEAKFTLSKDMELIIKL